MTYDRVVVATDFSDEARGAARLAPRLAGPRAESHAVHVLPTPARPLLALPGAFALPEDDPARIEELTRSLAAWAEASGLPRPVPIVRDGVVAIEVGRVAREIGADLVVVGARGTSRLERILLGSTARPILREAPCDVLLGRGATGEPPQRILVATDFHPPSRRAGERALAIARAHGASIEGIHAIDPSAWGMTGYPNVPGDAAKTLEEVVVHLAGSYARDVLAGEGVVRSTYERAHVAVAQRARDLRADLVVVATHGARPLERLLLGSVAEAVAERAPCSVLVVRAPR